jgi:hypothetical protein
VTGETRSRRALAKSGLAVIVLLLFAVLMLLRARTQNEQKVPTGPVYNPYPAGILPSDLSSETDRVLR